VIGILAAISQLGMDVNNVQLLLCLILIGIGAIAAK
jgi:hypothetical protein